MFQFGFVPYINAINVNISILTKNVHINAMLLMMIVAKLYTFARFLSLTEIIIVTSLDSGCRGV